MRPASKKTDNRIEMFRERLDNILNRHHELCKLSALIDWEAFEREFGMLYADKKGRPGIPIRLLVGLSYLGHAFGLSQIRQLSMGGLKLLTGVCHEHWYLHRWSCVNDGSVASLWCRSQYQNHPQEAEGGFVVFCPSFFVWQIMAGQE